MRHICHVEGRINVSVVPLQDEHMYHLRGDTAMTEQKKTHPQYAKELKYGNTVVRIAKPDPVDENQKQKILMDYHQAGWAILGELLTKNDK